MKNEFKRVIGLAIPAVLAQVSFMTMGLVDTLIVGKLGGALGAEALSGTGVGSSLSGAAFGVGIGFLLGMDSRISQAAGAKDEQLAGDLLYQGIWLSLATSIFLSIVLFLISHFLEALNVDAKILPHAQPYLNWVTWSILPALLFTALQRYWMAIEMILPITIIMIFANVLNLFVDLALVLGKWGFPKLGAEGAGLATLFCRIFMLSSFLIYTLWKPQLRRIRHHIRPKWNLIKNLLSLGVPAAGQVAFEVGAFAVATLLASQLGPIAAASHHIALTIASMTFMVPLGISIATSVRVGNLIGSSQPGQARSSGYLSLLLGTFLMTSFGVVFLAIPETLVGLFSSDPEIIHTGKMILFWAALFQIVDGIQVIATGALRGLANTRISLIANMIGHFGFGIPVGALICFYLEKGVIGLWIGLSLGLFLVAMILLYFWNTLSRPTQIPFAPQRPLSDLS